MTLRSGYAPAARYADSCRIDSAVLAISHLGALFAKPLVRPWRGGSAVWSPKNAKKTLARGPARSIMSQHKPQITGVAYARVR